MTTPQTTIKTYPPKPIAGGSRVPTPSTWIDDRGKLYVVLEYVFTDVDSVLENRPKGVMLYELIKETRFELPVLEFNKRVQAGKLIRYANSLS